MGRGPLRWFLGAFAAGALVAVSLVTCSRSCQAEPDPIATHLRAVASRHLTFLAESSR